MLRLRLNEGLVLAEFLTERVEMAEKKEHSILMCSRTWALESGCWFLSWCDL